MWFGIKGTECSGVPVHGPWNIWFRVTLIKFGQTEFDGWDGTEPRGHLWGYFRDQIRERGVRKDGGPGVATRGAPERVLLYEGRDPLHSLCLEITVTGET